MRLGTWSCLPPYYLRRGGGHSPRLSGITQAYTGQGRPEYCTERIHEIAIPTSEALYVLFEPVERDGINAVTVPQLFRVNSNTTADADVEFANHFSDELCSLDEDDEGDGMEQTMEVEIATGSMAEAVNSGATPMADERRSLQALSEYATEISDSTTSFTANASALRRLLLFRQEIESPSSS